MTLATPPGLFIPGYVRGAITTVEPTGNGVLLHGVMDGWGVVGVEWRGAGVV